MGKSKDDVVTMGAQAGFEPPDSLRSDQFFVNGLRIPYQQSDRNPEGVGACEELVLVGPASRLTILKRPAGRLTHLSATLVEKP